MTRLQRMRSIQAKNERIWQAQRLANITGQPQVVVRDRVSNQPCILPYAIRKGQPGGVTVWPKR